MISTEEVKNIASLSRIHLKDAEAGILSQDLEKILDYINKLEQLELSGIDPTTHVLPLKNVFRKDAVIPSLKQEQALSFSIEQKDGAFKVPKIIE